MKKELTQKNIRKYVWLYILIFLVINTMCAFLPAHFQISTKDIDSFNIWIDFISRHIKVYSLINITNYIIPVIAAIIYIHPKNKSKMPSRFVNMAFRFAGISCFGWLFYIVVQTVILIYLKQHLGINIGIILLDELVFSIFMAFFCFTISYFVLESIHREKVLPMFFPEGYVRDIPVRRRATLMMKIRNFYISVSLCPVIYVVSCYVTTAHLNNISVGKRMFLVLTAMLVMGFILLYLTIRYLNIPLKKLKFAAERIKNDDYSAKVDFVSNDDFGELADAFNGMSHSLQEKNKRLDAIQNSIIVGMALMVESRDINTGGHIKRTSDCVRIFVEKLCENPYYEHVSSTFYSNIIKAAPMHDLGKIAVDDAVLRKPGKFEPEEYEMMKTHSAAGAKIVEQVIREVEDEEFKRIAINVAHYHHEKWNGEGYPAGLKGEEIPFEARIMALADVFDALVSRRCYKDSFTYDKAFSIIKESLGSHFDPELGAQFLSCRPELEKLYKSYED